MSHRHGLVLASIHPPGGIAVPVVGSGLYSADSSLVGRDCYLAGWLLDEVELAAMATLWLLLLVAFHRQGNSDATARR